MKEKATASFSSDDLATVETGRPKEKEDLIESLFEHLDEDATARLLCDFCDGDRETYNNDPSVTEVTFEKKFSGTLTVEFTGSAYYGCEDLDRTYDHSKEVAFVISPEKRAITFSTDVTDPADKYREDDI
jgi:hypothetical protein